MASEQNRNIYEIHIDKANKMLSYYHSNGSTGVREWYTVLIPDDQIKTLEETQNSELDGWIGFTETEINDIISNIKDMKEERTPNMTEAYRKGLVTDALTEHLPGFCKKDDLGLDYLNPLIENF